MCGVCSKQCLILDSNIGGGTSNFGGWNFALKVEFITYLMQRFRGNLKVKGEISSPDSSEINTGNGSVQKNRDSYVGEL